MLVRWRTLIPLAIGLAIGASIIAYFKREVIIHKSIIKVEKNEKYSTILKRVVKDKKFSFVFYENRRSYFILFSTQKKPSVSEKFKWERLESAASGSWSTRPANWKGPKSYEASGCLSTLVSLIVPISVRRSSTKW